ncbi:MAG: site-specific DNA-methyltransferase, partial [Hyphomonadaceae bacterium]|nr:site-specific DNA-methyltransferase [Hyphomonadaceae bacterium]
RFIGIEREKAYLDVARARLAATEPHADEATAPLPSRREAPRVPFAAIVERGFIKPGDKLVDARERRTARVRADGTLKAGDAEGSIHRVGAAVQRAPACNGWTFWSLETKQGPKPIDLFRREIRRQMAMAPSA